MFESIRSSLIVTAIAAVAVTSTAQAEVSDDCSAWTLFPDFRCESRTARPEGSFNPVGMPYLFEDPHITTGLNFAYVYHMLPDGPAFDGGDAHILALQIRLAITDKLAFIATKDGLTMLYPGDNAAVSDDVGIFDMTMGFKYALFETDNFILSPAIRYEIPLGSEKLFQGYSTGVFIPSASFRWGFLERANLIGSLGGQLPIDSQRNVQSVFYNIHLDYGFKLENSIVKYIVPFIELNGMHYTSSGEGTNPIHLSDAAASALGVKTVPLSVAQGPPPGLGTGPFEGFDVANLGSQGINGADVVVMGGGIRVPTTWGISFAAMYEGPVTSRKDIHDQRFTFMATWEL